MNGVKDIVGTTTMIALIMLAIVGAFYSAMGTPSERRAVVMQADTQLQ